jgi:hypothetical protein
MTQRGIDARPKDATKHPAKQRWAVLALSTLPLMALDATAQGDHTSDRNLALAVEQTSQGLQPPARLLALFESLGFGFQGPQGTARLRNPSDNSLAVGPNHIVATVNSHMAIFTKSGAQFGETGRVLYGPVPTHNVFKDFGGPCETINNGDAVVRYDQLAERWLIVMPIFKRLPPRENEPSAPKSGEPARYSLIGNPEQPGTARVLFQPAAPPMEEQLASGQRFRDEEKREDGSFAMCYAISTSSDPLGAYYRYEFVRPLFPDYPRPAVWPDGYYVPTSTGDDVIERHACVVEREKMLAGEPAREQCLIVDNVSFLNNADIDGFEAPPTGAPNIVLATGGAQLRGKLGDDALYAWNFHVDWDNPAKTRLDGPQRLAVAPYEFLCGGQLTECVPQPNTEQRLDSQGDKIMSRLIYRRIGDRESLVAVHSINTTAGGGGVRWYELRLDEQRDLTVHQQGTYAPDANYRWLPSPAMDRDGNILIGYSYGGPDAFPGQRVAARLNGDPLGLLTLREAVLVEGEDSQRSTLRWQDYTQTAVDPSDDCTIWYVGDYLQQGAEHYSSRIGAWQLGDCGNSK